MPSGNLLLADTDESMNAITARLGKSKGHMTLLLRISYLAPSIIDDVLAGRGPTDLGPHRLMRLSKDLPLDWAGQRRFLGFHQAELPERRHFRPPTACAESGLERRRAGDALERAPIASLERLRPMQPSPPPERTGEFLGIRDLKFSCQFKELVGGGGSLARTSLMGSGPDIRENSLIFGAACVGYRRKAPEFAVCRSNSLKAEQGSIRT